MVVGSSFLSASRNCSFSVMLASSPDTSLKLTDFAGCRQPSRGPFFLDVIYTIGHSTRELGEFLSLLAAHRVTQEDRKSTRLNSSHLVISYAVFCLKKKKD